MDGSTHGTRITRAALSSRASRPWRSAFTVAAQRATAARLTPPPVPAKLEVEEGNEAFLVGHAIGTQNYICLPSGRRRRLDALHAAGHAVQRRGAAGHRPTSSAPTPYEAGVAVRAAWQHSRDTSTVWGKVTRPPRTPQFVTPGAIPWLLVNVKDTGARSGTDGWPEADDDDLHSTTEYRGRRGAARRAAPCRRTSAPRRSCPTRPTTSSTRPLARHGARPGLTRSSLPTDAVATGRGGGTMNETEIQELRARFRGELIPPGDAAYDARPEGLQRHDRPAPRADRPVRGRGRRDRGRQLRPRARSCCSPCAAAGTTAPGSASATAGW